MIQLIYCVPFIKMHIIAIYHSASILRPLVSSRTKGLLSFTILIPVPFVLPIVRPPTSYRTAFKTSFKTKVVLNFTFYWKLKKTCHVLSIYSGTRSFFDEAGLCRLVKISFRIVMMAIKTVFWWRAVLFLIHWKYMYTYLYLKYIWYL